MCSVILVCWHWGKTVGAKGSRGMEAHHVSRPIATCKCEDIFFLFIFVPLGDMPREFVFYPDPQFKCDLVKMQCTARCKNGRGPRCKRDVVIGLDKCWTHLMKDHKLKIKETSLRGLKFKGLFAWDKTKGEHARIFQKGDLIVPYNGEVLTQAEMEGRYGEGDDNTAPYVIENDKTKRFEDAACKRTAASISTKPVDVSATMPSWISILTMKMTTLSFDSDQRHQKQERDLLRLRQVYRLDGAITHRTRYKRRR